VGTTLKVCCGTSLIAIITASGPVLARASSLQSPRGTGSVRPRGETRNPARCLWCRA